MSEHVRRFTVKIRRVDRYPVEIAEGLLARVGENLRGALGVRRLAVLTDERVREVHGNALRRSLRRAGLEGPWIAVPPGERSKNLRVLARVLRAMGRVGFDRRATLLCFGGGTVCDLGGFAASVYMRGVGYVNVPTTLVAQVDAALGGKVAVNTAEAKNLIGAFHQPRAVWIDPALLRTLRPRDHRAGFGEVVKASLLAKNGLFERLERDREALLARDRDVLERTIEAAARIKMELVGRDPYERDLRRALNLGHTIGHSIEADHRYFGIRHGEAVAFGVATAAEIARSRGLLAGGAAERILALLEAYGLPTWIESLDVGGTLRRMRTVRIVRGGRLLFVVPTGIGQVAILDEVPDEEFRRAFHRLRRRKRRARCA